MRKASGATNNGAAFVLWVVVVPMALMAASAYYWTAAFPKAIPLRSGATPESVDVGQKFEVLGAVFTLGGYVALLATLWYQRQQLVDQRQRAAEDQVRSEFFQLLEAWQEIIRNAGYRGEAGRATFVKLSEQLASVVEMKIGGEPGSDECNPNALYELFYKGDVKALLGNYFRLFYHIIRYVDQSDLSQKDKDGLVRIARAICPSPNCTCCFGMQSASMAARRRSRWLRSTTCCRTTAGLMISNSKSCTTFARQTGVQRGSARSKSFSYLRLRSRYTQHRCKSAARLYGVRPCLIFKLPQRRCCRRWTQSTLVLGRGA